MKTASGRRMHQVEPESLRIQSHLLPGIMFQSEADLEEFMEFSVEEFLEDSEEE